MIRNILDWAPVLLVAGWLIATWMIQGFLCDPAELDLMRDKKRQSLASPTAAWTDLEEEYLQSLERNCDCR